MKKPRAWAILAANVLWLAACLPGAARFLMAVLCPRLCQRHLLRSMLYRARETRFGRQHGFDALRRHTEGYNQVPIAGYEAFRPFITEILGGAPQVLTADPVSVLQPTSGTSAQPKWIPFSQGLQRQFQAALAPWLASLYILRPRLLFGRQYWCLSPNTRPITEPTGAVPIRFAADTDYLGALQQWAARHLLVAPPELAQVEDPSAFSFLTLLFLVREADLRLISVWHPSFLTVLLDALPRHAEALASCVQSGMLPTDLVLPPPQRKTLSEYLHPDPARAEQIRSCLTTGPELGQRLWPHLEVISCWTGPDSEPCLKKLRALFPQTTIQGKGLLATEGVVSIPWGFGGKCICAVNSHFIEFLAPAAQTTQLCWEVKKGACYSVVLTTAGGLYRYRLGDRVRVTGFVGRTPLLEFCGREGVVSDLRGEKLTLDDAELALNALASQSGDRFGFAMLVPDCRSEVPRYALFFQTDSPLPTGFAAVWGDLLEKALCRNFHYHHARRLGQLASVGLFSISGDPVLAYRQHLARQGLRQGDMKFSALRRETGWQEAFAGKWLETTVPHSNSASTGSQVGTRS